MVEHKILKLVWGVLGAFLTILAIAMVLYPDKSGHIGGYSFFYEYISALGMTRTHQGSVNIVSCLLFNISLGVAMLVLIPFWYLRSKCINGRLGIKMAAFVFCTCFSLGIFGVALTPYNLLASLHDVSVYSALAFIIPGCLIMIVCAESFYCPRSYKVILVAFVLVVLLCELVLQIMIIRHAMPVRPAGPIMQKVNVAIFVGWVVAELLLYGRYLRLTPKLQPVRDDAASVS